MNTLFLSLAIQTMFYFSLKGYLDLSIRLSVFGHNFAAYGPYY